MQSHSHTFQLGADSVGGALDVCHQFLELLLHAYTHTSHVQCIGSIEACALLLLLLWIDNRTVENAGGRGYCVMRLGNAGEARDGAR